MDKDLALFFFSEFGNAQNVNAAGNFQDSLSRYTSDSLSKLTSLSGNWTNDHELMLSTFMQERFAMSSVINQANIEI